MKLLSWLSWNLPFSQCYITPELQLKFKPSKVGFSWCILRSCQCSVFKDQPPTFEPLTFTAQKPSDAGRQFLELNLLGAQHRSLPICRLGLGGKMFCTLANMKCLGDMLLSRYVVHVGYGYVRSISFLWKNTAKVTQYSAPLMNEVDLLLQETLTKGVFTWGYAYPIINHEHDPPSNHWPVYSISLCA